MFFISTNMARKYFHSVWHLWFQCYEQSINIDVLLNRNIKYSFNDWNQAQQTLASTTQFHSVARIIVTYNNKCLRGGNTIWLTYIRVFRRRQPAIWPLCSSQSKLQKGHVLTCYHSVASCICCHQTVNKQKLAEHIY